MSLGMDLIDLYELLIRKMYHDTASLVTAIGLVIEEIKEHGCRDTTSCGGGDAWGHRGGDAWGGRSDGGSSGGGDACWGRSDGGSSRGGGDAWGHGGGDACWGRDRGVCPKQGELENLRKSSAGVFDSNVNAVAICLKDLISNASLYKILFTRNKTLTVDQQKDLCNRSIDYLREVCKKREITENCGIFAQESGADAEFWQKVVCLFNVVIGKLRGIGAIEFIDNGIIFRSRSTFAAAEVMVVCKMMEATDLVENGNEITDVFLIRNAILFFLLHLLQKNKQRIVMECCNDGRIFVCHFV
jgi:hypothetical protein